MKKHHLLLILSIGAVIGLVNQADQHSATLKQRRFRDVPCNERTPGVFDDFSDLAMVHNDFRRRSWSSWVLLVRSTFALVPAFSLCYGC